MAALGQVIFLGRHAVKCRTTIVVTRKYFQFSMLLAVDFYVKNFSG